MNHHIIRMSVLLAAYACFCLDFCGFVSLCFALCGKAQLSSMPINCLLKPSDHHTNIVPRGVRGEPHYVERFWPAVQITHGSQVLF